MREIEKIIARTDAVEKEMEQWADDFLDNIDFSNPPSGILDSNGKFKISFQIRMGQRDYDRKIERLIKEII